MAYINIVFKAMNIRAKALTNTVQSAQKLIDSGQPQSVIDKATQIKNKNEAEIAPLVAEYRKVVANALKNNDDYAKSINEWHATAKDSVAEAKRIVDRAEKGQIDKDSSKWLSKWERVVKQIRDKMKAEGRDLMAAMKEFRGNEWKKGLGLLDKAAVAKLEKDRNKSMDKNGVAVAQVKRVEEYVKRMELLTSRLAVLQKAEADNMGSIASECKQLMATVKKDCVDLTKKIEGSSLPIQKMVHKLRRCKTHAEAVKLVPTYETVIGQVLGRWPGLYKNSSGVHKTLKLKVENFEKKVKGTPAEKGFSVHIEAMKRQLAELKSTADILKAETVATEKRLKELTKTKKK